MTKADAFLCMSIPIPLIYLFLEIIFWKPIHYFYSHCLVKSSSYWAAFSGFQVFSVLETQKKIFITFKIAPEFDQINLVLQLDKTWNFYTVSIYLEMHSQIFFFLHDQCFSSTLKAAHIFYLLYKSIIYTGIDKFITINCKVKCKFFLIVIANSVCFIHFLKILCFSPK